MTIVFLGAPGVGKGTQAALLSQRHGWRHVSTGKLLREAVAGETDLGLRAKQAMESGDLVSDDIILSLIKEILESETRGVILDGFPRTLEQARGLDALLESMGRELERVVLLNAKDEELVKRLSLRGRADDDEETVLHRLHVYEERTAPLVGYYDDRGILIRVNGVGEIEEIQDRIDRVLRNGTDG